MLLLRCRWGGGLPRTWFWGSPPGARSGLPPPGAHVAAAPRPVHPWSRGAPVVAPAGRWGARAFQPPPSRFPLEPRVPRAVVLFEHERRRFFGLLGLFCAAQFTFWAVLAHLAFRTWRDPDAEREGQPEPPPQKALLNWGSGKWRYGFSLSCLTVGVLILSAGYLFSRRSVSRILLHRGGQEVSLTTYYPFGLTSSFTVPLRHVCCMSHRSEVRAMIPLKVKGRPFYFLLDKDGRITNAELFDVTVGAYRML